MAKLVINGGPSAIEMRVQIPVVRVRKAAALKPPILHPINDLSIGLGLGIVYEVSAEVLCGGSYYLKSTFVFKKPCQALFLCNFRMVFKASFVIWQFSFYPRLD